MSSPCRLITELLAVIMASLFVPYPWRSLSPFLDVPINLYFFFLIATLSDISELSINLIHRQTFK